MSTAAAGRTAAVGAVAPVVRRLWWLAGPLVLAATGGALVARRTSLWFDEVYTAEVVRLPAGRVLEAGLGGHGIAPYLADTPPSYNLPYYLAAEAWLAVTRLPADETGLRLLSLVAAVAAVAVATRAVDRLAGRGAAVVGGLLLAANPLVVEYAAEARPYGLAMLAVASAALALSRWLACRPGAAARFAVAAGAAGLAHWYALLPVAGLVVAATALRGRRAWPLAAAGAAGAVPAALLAANAARAGYATSGSSWLPDVGAAVPWRLLDAWSGGSPALAAVTAVLGLAALALGLSRRAPATVVAAAWSLVPIAAVTAASLVRPAYVARYLLPAALGLGILAALGAVGLPGRLRPLAVGAALLATAAAAPGAVLARPPEDVRGAVAAVATLHRPGEPVVAPTGWDALGLEHHARRWPSLQPDLVLAGPVPPASTVWVVRRQPHALKGVEVAQVRDLEASLAQRGMRPVTVGRFPGRDTAVLLQRWE